MSVEEINKESVRRLTEEVFNEWDLSVAHEVVDPEIVEYLSGVPAPTTQGFDDFRQLVLASKAAFPDFHYTIEEMVAEGDRVAVRYSFTATHLGEYMGIPATGKKMSGTSAYFCRFKDGRQVEVYGFINMLDLYRQLGVSPPSF